jgi:hypothetical protein
MTLLREISHCPIIELCFRHPSTEHPCANIVRSQHSPSLADHQVPEPWSGDLEHAPILFLSSNPSLSEVEEYPRWSWPPDLTEDYFVRRFGGGRKPWVIRGVKSLQSDGTHGPAVKFWAAVRKRAEELLERAPTPGVDYALTEVVHCKSRAEEGVQEALAYCATRYLTRVLEQAGAKVIVVLGGHAKRTMQAKFRLKETSVLGPIQLGGRERYIAFLPHPNAREERSFVKRVSPDVLEALRAFLR